MRLSGRLRLIVCLAAVLAAVGLHAYGHGAVAGIRVTQPAHVVDAQANAIAGTVATRVETLARDEAERPASWFGALFALAAAAFTSLSVGHRRRGVVLAGAIAPQFRALPALSSRAPPVGRI